MASIITNGIVKYGNSITIIVKNKEIFIYSLFLLLVRTSSKNISSGLRLKI